MHSQYTETDVSLVFAFHVWAYTSRSHSLLRALRKLEWWDVLRLKLHACERVFRVQHRDLVTYLTGLCVACIWPKLGVEHLASLDQAVHHPFLLWRAFGERVLLVFLHVGSQLEYSLMLFFLLLLYLCNQLCIRDQQTLALLTASFLVEQLLNAYLLLTKGLPFILVQLKWFVLWLEPCVLLNELLQQVVIFKLVFQWTNHLFIMVTHALQFLLHEPFVKSLLCFCQFLIQRLLGLVPFDVKFI